MAAILGKIEYAAPTGVGVTVAADADRVEVARALGLAFADDPVMRWMVPRTVRYAELFAANARFVHNAPGSTDLATAHGRTVGASLWDPPGHHPSLRRTLVSYPFFAAVLRGRSAHALALDAAFRRHRPRRDHWYLAQIGATRPGHGIGAALLTHRLEMIEGPAYLENSNERNIDFYERFGFRVTGEIKLPLHGPTCWTMWRD